MKKHTVIPGQSLFDVAITVYGDVSGVTWLIKDNGLAGPTDRIYADQILLYREEIINLRQKVYLQDFPKIATIKEPDMPEGIGFWRLDEYVVQSISFSTAPYYDPAFGYIFISIDMPGTYYVKVTNLTNGAIYRDGDQDFLLDGNGDINRLVIPITEPGDFEIVVGHLTAHVKINTL